MKNKKQKKNKTKPTVVKHSGSKRVKSSSKTSRKKTSSVRQKGKRTHAFTVDQLSKGNVLVKGNKHITLAKAKEMRSFLLRLRERLTGQINFLATDNLSRSEKDNDISFRSEEQGTDNFDRDFALNRVSLDQDIMFEIDEAFDRLALGTYGICDCGRGIEKARLKAVPYSRMCIACKSKNENGQKKFKSFESAASFHSTDKAATETAAEEE